MKQHVQPADSQTLENINAGIEPGIELPRAWQIDFADGNLVGGPLSGPGIDESVAMYYIGHDGTQTLLSCSVRDHVCIAGGMFWFSRKRLSGSNRALRSTRRS